MVNVMFQSVEISCIIYVRSNQLTEGLSTVCIRLAFISTIEISFYLWIDSINLRALYSTHLKRIEIKHTVNMISERFWKD